MAIPRRDPPIAKLPLALTRRPLLSSADSSAAQAEMVWPSQVGHKPFELRGARVVLDELLFLRRWAQPDHREDVLDRARGDEPFPRAALLRGEPL